VPIALVLLGSVTASVQARPAGAGTRIEEARERRIIAREEHAAARAQRATERAERAAARQAAREAREETRGRGLGNERENAVVTSTCSMLNWTFRKFPNMPHNSLLQRVTVGHFAHVFKRLDFDGPGVVVTTPINAPPGRSKIDALARWKTNGARGHFDIESKKRCPPAPALTIEKLQRIAGTGSFTASPLAGLINQTVEYEMIVRNTGNVPLVLSSFSDPNCDAGTMSGGQGETPLAPGPTPSLGDSTTYTCSHVITSVSVYENTASVTATPPPGEGSPITHPSNTVVVNAPTPEPALYVGYADGAANDHGSPSGLPSPWQGSEGVTFIGCGFGGTDSCPTSNGVDVYDAGAIRIDASSATGAVSVTGAKVVIGPCTYEPWPGLSVTIQPGHSLILTQTGKHRCNSTTSAEQDNFDTSESFLKSPQYQEFLKTGKCANDGYVASITLTINGHTTTLSDTGQTLNDHGVDADICTHTSEAANWVQLHVAGARTAGAVARPTVRHRARSHARARHAPKRSHTATLIHLAVAE
jgi:hypothetical protein